MATDWTAIKTEYVHGSSAMRELAAKHGIKAAGLMKRAANEGWDTLRKQFSAEVSKRASQNLTETTTSTLSEFNAADLQVARALRENVAEQINGAYGPIPPNDLRSLASAAEAAQRIGRLALGVATERTASTVAVVQVAMTPDEFKRLAREMAGRT